MTGYNFRKATIDDKKVVAGLLEFIYSLDLQITNDIGKEKLSEIVYTCFTSSLDRFSYKNCSVVEKNNEIVGFSFSYSYDFIDITKDFWYENIVPSYELQEGSIIFDYDEVLPGEYYLDTLYTFSEYRGKGIGKILLDNFVKVEQRKKSLNVAKNNYGAMKLYESYGFSKNTEILIGGHFYNHMVLEK